MNQYFNQDKISFLKPFYYFVTTFFYGMFCQDSYGQKSTFEDFIQTHPFNNRPILPKSSLKKLPVYERPDYHAEFEYLRTVDPSILRVPTERIDRAYDDVNKSIIRQKLGLKVAGIQGIANVNWQERGPNNIGGRTRAIMFDPKDTLSTDASQKYKKVWAGSASGGLWFNNDITSSSNTWQKVNDFWDNLAVMSMAYDPSNKNVMYVGTGEFTINADAVSGGGIWRTMNGGTTWTRLVSTIPFGGVGASREFNWVSKIVVNKYGSVFAGTNKGVYKSTDKGVSWTKILAPKNNIGGVNLSAVPKFTDTVSDIEIGTDNVLFVAMGYYDVSVSTPSNIIEQGRVFRASDTTGTIFTDITPNIQTISTNAAGRIELALAPSTNSNSQVVYAVGSNGISGDIKWFKKSINAGTTWTEITIPTYPNGSVFTSLQSWYDLILQVKPDDPNTLFAGGTSYFRTDDGGTSWTMLSDYAQYIHPDMHVIEFRPTFPKQIVWGNDGGVYFSPDATQNPSNSFFQVRNTNYNVTQFYGVAMKNLADKTYLLSGAQDNGTMNLKTNGIGNGFYSSGGDGMIGAIDQDNANIQIGSYYGGNYYLIDRYGNQGATLPLSGGLFVDPLAYDSKQNILFSTSDFSSALDRITGVGITNTDSYLLIGANTITPVSTLKIGYSPNTLFIGTRGGRIYKLTNTDLSSATATRIDMVNTSGIQAGNVSCIELGANDAEILVTYSNFGVKSVWYTNDGGITWTSKDEPTYGLPDMPIRWALMNPDNKKQVLLATEVGVWSTNDIIATNPEWTVTNNGLANVRSDMITYRDADGLIAIATHGRGVFTADIFQKTHQIVVNNPIGQIIMSCSGNAINIPLAFTSKGIFNNGNTFTAELSDANGQFNNPTSLGIITINANTVTISGTLPQGNYQLRIVSSSPVVYGYADFNVIKVCDYCQDLSSNCSYGDYISKVTLKSGATELLNNNSGCTNGGYFNYSTTTPTTNVVAGSSYSLSINTSNTELNAITAWIDFNRDSTFSSTEVVYMDASAYVDGGIPRTVSFVIPTNTKNGNTRMRIRNNYGAVTSNPCGGLGFGETEDYRITISGGIINAGINSVASGDWNNINTWNCNCVPTKTDDVTINSGHTIIINGIFGQIKKLIFAGGDLFFVNNGFLQY